MLRSLHVYDLSQSLVTYSKGLKLQDHLISLCTQPVAQNSLLLLQHTAVYTIGKRGKELDFKVSVQALKERGYDIVSCPRGGEVTYHGPGQLVAYPIISLRSLGIGARAYVEGLEDCLIDLLHGYRVQGKGRIKGATGIWVGERKIAAIGVRISQGISSHGIALNVNTDLSHFDAIVPCGIADKEVTSLRLESPNTALDMQQISNSFAMTFMRHFNFDNLVHMDTRSLNAL